ncbi:hypothetical protein [Streptomyces purpurogeneiscleroticus]|uniref:hypothetical protein n=1 Tax=Streptomyces purpurogeneiscleroticus TaxID=68259 RepID=UPI001CC07A48|nr:hypothetical protein [Streptomyces purpurogeneiscleroticus]MBZ4017494.1 hypothetical protein [Streptomyces purpurogeneiscleroticus]
MSLVELVARADARGLAASGLACLDRCLPLLGADDDALRPLWASLTADGAEWGTQLAAVRAVLPPGPADDTEPAVLVRRMLDDAPATRSDEEALRAWADACSSTALHVHHLLDHPGRPYEGPHTLADRRAGRTDGTTPLVEAELRRQTTILELLAGHGPAGLRQAVEISAEGRRVLRAVVSRQARGAV